MIIKPEKWKKIKKVVNVRISEDVYGCDNCRKKIDPFAKTINYLDLTVFMQDNGNEKLQFCSWNCVLKYLPKIKCDYFVSMPMLYFDTTEKGVSAKDLIKCLK